MRAPQSLLSLLTLSVLSACARPSPQPQPAAATSSGSSTSNPASTAAFLPIVPMHLDTGTAAEPRAMAELRSDGSIFVRSAMVARIQGTQLITPTGRVIITVMPDGSLVEPGRPSTASVTERGDIETAVGRLTIERDLSVMATASDGRVHGVDLHFDSVPENARRTAGLFLLAVIPHISPTGAETRLAVPATISGTLESSDLHLADGSVADSYRLSLRGGQPVTIVVRGGASTSQPGTNLDVYTILMQSGAEITHDDDSAGNFNSRIIYTPPSDGEYTLRITTYGSGLKTGAYQVETLLGARPDAT